MRGKASKANKSLAEERITPAYAGKSSKYLFAISAVLGSPPRMRGKVVFPVENSVENGITPAYAGKRMHGTMRTTTTRDHPRVCGEKCRLIPAFCRVVGSPPRMRGKETREGHIITEFRITPAYAGKSRNIAELAASFRDHPRVCGEKQFTLPK